MDTDLKAILRATAADPAHLNRLVEYVANADDPVAEARQIVAEAKARADAEYQAGVQQAQEAEARRARRSVSDLIHSIPMDSATAQELLEAIESEKGAPVPAPEPAPA